MYNKKILYSNEVIFVLLSRQSQPMRMLQDVLDELGISVGTLHDSGIQVPDIAINAYYLDDLAMVFRVLNDLKMLKENATYLYQDAQYIANYIEGHSNLTGAGINTQEHLALLCRNARYAERLAFGLVVLDRESMQEYMILLCQNAKYAVEFSKGLCVLKDAGILTTEHIDLLRQYVQYADCLAELLCASYRKGTLDTFKNYIKNDKSLGEILLILKLAGLKENGYTSLANLSTSKDIYEHIICSENTELFNQYIKTVIFFIANLKAFKQASYSSEEINTLLSKMRPISLRHHLNKILNKLGGYNLPENVTRGIEIEFSGIPRDYKRLIENVMDIIQTGWSHPGDWSVTRIGENTYSGESTTPIIYNNGDLRLAMLNIAFLQAIGAATNTSCGLHVHVGIKNLETPEAYKKTEKVIKEDKFSYTNYQLEFMKQFLRIYKREAAKFMSIERDSNRHAKTVTIPENIREIRTLSELIQQVNPPDEKSNPDRLYEFNLHAFLKHGTIEVRAFSGTTEESVIYGTIAMISAIANEAMACTHAIFDKEITTDEKKDDKPAAVNASQSFFSRRKTEQQTELFMLRVKQIHESEVRVQPSAELEEKSKNTVYVYLTQDNIIKYAFYDKKGNTKIGAINDKRFENVIQKLKLHQPLDTQEKNQILVEVSVQSGALLSNRVDKIKQILYAPLTSCFKRNERSRGV